MSHHITIYPDGQVIPTGIDQPPTKVHHQSSRGISHGIFVTKTEGGSYWAGIGIRKYAGAFFSVMRWGQPPEEDQRGYISGRVLTLIEFPVRAKS